MQTITSTNRILILQKAAVRIMSFSQFRAHSAPLFADLKLLTIFDLVKVLNILFVHDVLNKNVPDEVLECFNFTAKMHDHYTRENVAGCLEIPNVNTNSYGISSLSFQSISNWNSISRVFVDPTDKKLVTWKRHVLKRSIINHYSSFYH